MPVPAPQLGMGMAMDHTDYVGRVDVRPTLNDEEAARRRAVRPLPHERLLVDAVPGRLLPRPGAAGKGRESPAVWLRYLLTDVLGSGHRLDGVLVGFRRGTGELFSISVANNRVHEKVLRAGSAARKPQRRTPKRTGAAVIDLAERRASRR